MQHSKQHMERGGDEVPFFGFNYYFYFIKGMFTDWMLLDFAGNVGILASSLLGYRLSVRESATGQNL